MTSAAPAASSVLDTLDVDQRKWIRRQLYLAFAGLAVGVLMGLLQVLERLNIDLYDEVQLQSYYQGLTMHGVATAIVFTFTFSNAFLALATARGLGRPLASTNLVIGSFVTAALGLVLALAAMVTNSATVLYTFYAPLEASSLFYLGAVLLVVSTWLVSVNQLLTLRAWRRQHPGERIPLLAFTSIVTYLMWDLASVGIAVEVVVFLLPWALGWVAGTDPLLTRTLFWFTGHPIVYFWLLPAYVSWYMMVPRRAGGKLYSDAIVRAVFIMFLLLSTPVGLHHQFTDPGVDSGLKFVHAILTFAVFFPSMVTAFTLLAAFENGGRARGGKGLFGWIRKLPWREPFVAPQLLAMLAFTVGGATGLINASFTVNLVVHNTAYIPGHFHLTVGTAVALSFMGISYWLVPWATGKKLWKPRLAAIQAWVWFVGMLIFSNAMHVVGLLGAPRRTPLGVAPYVPEEWTGHLQRVGLGGAILFVSAVMYVWILARTAWGKERQQGEVEIPVAEAMQDPQRTPRWLDRWVPWLVATVVLILIAYGPQLIDQIANIDLDTGRAPAVRPW